MLRNGRAPTRPARTPGTVGKRLPLSPVIGIPCCWHQMLGIPCCCWHQVPRIYSLPRAGTMLRNNKVHNRSSIPFDSFKYQLVSVVAAEMKERLIAPLKRAVSVQGPFSFANDRTLRTVRKDKPLGDAARFCPY